MVFSVLHSEVVMPIPVYLIAFLLLAVIAVFVLRPSPKLDYALLEDAFKPGKRPFRQGYSTPAVRPWPRANMGCITNESLNILYTKRLDSVRDGIEEIVECVLESKPGSILIMYRDGNPILVTQDNIQMIPSRSWIHWELAKKLLVDTRDAVFYAQHPEMTP